QGLVATLSLLIALGSAGFTGLIWHDTRQQFLLSTRPHIDFEIAYDPDEPPVGVAITNNGPGRRSSKRSRSTWTGNRCAMPMKSAGITQSSAKPNLDTRSLSPMIRCPWVRRFGSLATGSSEEGRSTRRTLRTLRIS